MLKTFKKKWFRISLIVAFGFLIIVYSALAGDGVGRPNKGIPKATFSVTPVAHAVDMYNMGSLSAINNTSAEFLGYTALSHSCEIYRTGTGAMTITFQGSLSNATSSWTNMTPNQAITNSPDDTWWLSVINEMALYIRGHCVSGCGVGNSVSFVNCTSGGGAQ